MAFERSLNWSLASTLLVLAVCPTAGCGEDDSASQDAGAVHGDHAAAGHEGDEAPSTDNRSAPGATDEDRAGKAGASGSSSNPVGSAGRAAGGSGGAGKDSSAGAGGDGAAGASAGASGADDSASGANDSADGGAGDAGTAGAAAGGSGAAGTAGSGGAGGSGEAGASGSGAAGAAGSAGAAGDEGEEEDDDGDHDHGDHDHDATVGPETGAECPSDSTLTYANFGMKFMQDYCLRCHSEDVTGAARMRAPSDHNFDSLPEIDLLAAHIDQRAGSGPDATNTSMPPSDPKPSTEERQKLSEWIACGVPE